MQFTVSMTVTVTHLVVADLSRARCTWTQVTQVEGALFHAPGWVTRQWHVTRRRLEKHRCKMLIHARWHVICVSLILLLRATWTHHVCQDTPRICQDMPRMSGHAMYVRTCHVCQDTPCMSRHATYDRTRHVCQDTPGMSGHARYVRTCQVCEYTVLHTTYARTRHVCEYTVLHTMYARTRHVCQDTPCMPGHPMYVSTQYYTPCMPGHTMYARTRHVCQDTPRMSGFICKLVYRVWLCHWIFFNQPVFAIQLCTLKKHNLQYSYQNINVFRFLATRKQQ